jgi:phage I-like protein
MTTVDRTPLERFDLDTMRVITLNALKGIRAVYGETESGIEVYQYHFDVDDDASARSWVKRYAGGHSSRATQARWSSYGGDAEWHVAVVDDVVTVYSALDWRAKCYAEERAAYESRKPDDGVARIIRCFAATKVSRGIPTEIKIMSVGVNKTLNGDYIYDEVARKQMMRSHREWGLKQLPIDKDHSLAYAPFVDGKAVGWFTPDFGEDGVYARDIEWTAEGHSLLEAKAYKHFSYDMFLDEEQRPESLLSLSLTNRPATQKQPQIVSLQATARDASIDTANTKEHKGINTERSRSMEGKVLKMLGLDSEEGLEDKVAELVASNKALADKVAEADVLRSQLYGMLGDCQDDGALLGGIAAMQAKTLVEPVEPESKSELEMLRQEVTLLREQQDEARREKLIQKFSTRISPSMTETVKMLAKALDEKQFETTMMSFPELTTPNIRPTSKDPEIGFTDADEKIMAQMGYDEQKRAEFLALKKIKKSGGE